MKISTTELLIVLAVVVVIFGPTQIPKLAKMMGKSIKNLRAGMTEDDEEKREQKPKSNEKTEEGVGGQDHGPFRPSAGASEPAAGLRDMPDGGLYGKPLFCRDIVELLTDIGKAYGYSYVYISPQELLLEHFSVALVASLCVSLAPVLYQLWAFIRPGLKKRENVFAVLAMCFGLVCFAGGVYFAYRLMLPFMLEFLIGITEGTYISAAISVHNYISFLLTIFVIFGVVFELPVVSVLLTQLGLIKVEWMKKARKALLWSFSLWLP